MYWLYNYQMRNINSVMNKFAFIGMGAWSVLGFKRGMNSYEYNCSKDEKYTKKSSETSPARPLYIEGVGWGFIGFVFYLTPPLCLIAAYKEIYRLEVNLRGIEDEKKSRFYNEIF